MVFVTDFVLCQEEKAVKIDSITMNNLDEVIVTGTRTKKQLALLPMPATVITKKQIEDSGANRLRDIIAEQTGIIMVPDHANAEGVQLQGLDADYTLILIDGLPVIGRVVGNIDLNRLSVGNIERIEIVKGPSSALYGSDALGGVINIITKKVKKDIDITEVELSSLTSFGAQEEFDFFAGLVHRKDKFSILSNINANTTGKYDLSPGDGVLTTDIQQNGTFNLNASYDFSDKLSFRSNNRFFKQTVNDAINGDAKRRDLGVNGEFIHKLSNKLNFNYMFYYAKHYTESVFDNETSVYDEVLYRPEIKADFKLGNSNLISGIGGNFSGLERTFFEGEELYNNYYGFIQYDFKPIEKLNVILGARYDYFNKFSNAFTPKLSSSYKVSSWFTAKASVGFGYKVPDFRYLFYNFRNSASGYIVLGTEVLHDIYGDEAQVSSLERTLNPESSVGYNFGFNIRPNNNLKIDVNFFRNDFKNLINSFLVGNRTDTTFSDLTTGTSVYSYENVSEAYTQGVEFEMAYKFHKNFKFHLGYQYLETANKEEVRAIENEEVYFRRTVTSSSELLSIDDYFGLANRSKHIANAKLFFTNSKQDLRVNLRAFYRSKYALFDTNSTEGIIDNYDSFVASRFLCNASITKTFLDVLDIQFGVNNLLNEDGSENTALFPPTDNVLQLGRTYYGKIQLRR